MSEKYSFWIRHIATIKIHILCAIFLWGGIWLLYPIIFTYHNQPGHVIIHDRNGILMTNKSNEYGYALKLDLDKYPVPEKIPIIQDIIKIEDKRFYRHIGVDFLSKFRSIWTNISSWEISGGSTLVEQWIKNKYFIHKKRTIPQKIREGFLAFMFSVTKSKQEILENYLNTIYLGNNIYGLQTASQTYFKKIDLTTLSEEERVILITLIRTPGLSLDDPLFQKYYQKVQKKLWYIFVPEVTYLPKHENIDYFPFVTRKALEICSGEIFEVTFFKKYDCKNGDFISTIDAKLWLFSREKMRNALGDLSDKNVTNAAVFALQPESHEVIIYEWSRDFYAKNIDWQVDILQSDRQPGSSIKPFLYLMALENGIQPDSLLIDTEEQYPSFQPWTTYISENYTLREYGLVRLKKALWNSLNNASVRLAKMLWLREVYNFYKSYGFKLSMPPEYYGYSLVLGNPSIKLYDMVLSYEKLIPKPNKNNSIDPNKFLLYEILKNPDNRDMSFGVNSILNTSILQAVKTGTSSNFRDNTVLSYGPEMIVGIWFWNNDNSPMIGVTGITGAGNTWHQIIEEMISKWYITEKNIRQPESIQTRPYCLDINCYRQEETHQKIGTKYYSSLSQNLYDHRDIPERLSTGDIQKLRDLGFVIK